MTAPSGLIARAVLNVVRAAAASTPADFALAPPAPQEPTVTNIQPGQVYVACHPLDEGRRIRVESYRQWDARALVVDADTGKRFRQILAAGLHPTATTRDGKPRRTGYALEGGAS